MTDVTFSESNPLYCCFMMASLFVHAGTRLINNGLMIQGAKQHFENNSAEACFTMAGLFANG